MEMKTFGSPDSEVIRHLEDQHRHYSEKLESLLQKAYLSAEEELEEIRLKKLKLSIKDEMAGLRNGMKSHLA